MAIEFIRQQFGAAQTAAITGVSADQQRNHRRSGFDRKDRPGHARHDAEQLARFQVETILKSLARVPPATSVLIAQSAAVIVLAFAAHVPGAVLDKAGLANGEAPVKGFVETLPRFLAWDGRQAIRLQSISDYFDRGGANAVLILDLAALATTLVQRAGPLWRVIRVRDA